MIINRFAFLVMGIIFSLFLIFAPINVRADFGQWLFGDLTSDFTDDLDEISNTRIDQVLAGIQNEIQSLMRKATQQSNVLLAQAANELSVAASTFDYLIGHQREDLVKDLSREFQPYLIALYKAQKKIEDLHQSAFDFRDLLYIDIDRLMGQIPGIKDRFYVRRIDGLTQVQHRKSDYDISIVGKNAGGFQSDEKISFSIRINNKEYSLITVTKNMDRADFLIDMEYLEPFFAHSEVRSIPIRIVARRERSDIFNTILRRIGKDDVGFDELVIETNMLLLPKKAGTLQIDYEYLIYEWKAVDPEVQTRVLRDSFDFQHRVASPDLLQEPSEGMMRHSHSDKIRSKCKTDIRNVRVFPDKSFLESSKNIFTDGLEVSCRLMLSMPSGINTCSLDARGIKDVYINRGTIKRSHRFSGRYFLKKTTEREEDFSGCDRMRVDTPALTNNKTQATVHVERLEPSDKQEAEWTVSFPIEKYMRTGIASEAKTEIAVVASEIIEVDIPDLDGVAGHVRFLPIFGESVESSLFIGDFADSGLERLPEIGAPTGDRRLSFKFEYPIGR